MERLTDNYMDKFKVERVEILNNYAKQTSDKGKMYYIYSKSAGNQHTYNLFLCEEGMSHAVIKIEQYKLPQGADLESVLRLENGEYILDKEATEEVHKKIIEMINRLVQEQTIESEKQRVEGHLYELVEKSDNTVWLMDKTNYTGECFQETNFSSQLMKEAKERSLYQYINGEYKYYSNNK